jgi:flagellar export protein FliJ
VPVFQFRLATVLRFRERIKEEKQWELQTLFAERQRLEEEIQRVEQEWTRVGEMIAAAAGNIFSGIELRLHSDYTGVLVRRIEATRAALLMVEAKLAAKREELIEAARDVKTLEQLRARLEQNFRRQQNALEQKVADEIGQRNFTRSGPGKKVPR